MGARSPQFLKIFRGRFSFYFMESKSHTTTAVGEYTGEVRQVTAGVDFGIYVTDYFYIFGNPLPYTSYLYTSGTKLRPLPGRTTDLRRTWDTGFVGGVGLEYKFAKWLSIGAEWRIFNVYNAMQTDSTGFPYDNKYYGGVLKLWY